MAIERTAELLVSASVSDRPVADPEIVFAHVDKSQPEADAIDQKSFVFSTKLLGVLDVGIAGDGSD